MLHVDAEKEPQWPHVFDSELSSETVDDVLQQGYARPSEDDIVHVEKEIGNICAMTKNEE